MDTDTPEQSLEDGSWFCEDILNEDTSLDNMSSNLATVLELTSADFKRRENERKIMEEEREKVKIYKNVQKRQKEEEMKRDREMLMNYNPWGRPGGGAPMVGDNRFKISSSENESMTEMDDELGTALVGFGRPGAGAPMRSESGRLLVQLSGDPEIRFQGNNVVRSIENVLRYKNVDKNAYKQELDRLVQEKKAQREKELEIEKQQDQMQGLTFFGKKPRRTSSLPKLDSAAWRNDGINYDPWGKGTGNPFRDDYGNVLPRQPRLNLPEISSPLPEEGVSLPLWKTRRGGGGAPKRTDTGTLMTKLSHKLSKPEVPGVDPDEDYNPWGKPGGGAPQQSTTGKDFLQKMGWSKSGTPARRNPETKRQYLEELRSEMERKKSQRRMSDNGESIVSIMSRKEVGKPKRDPNTGELLPNIRSTSDVTAQRMDIRRARSHESLEYMNTLVQQAEERRRAIEQRKIQDEIENQLHLRTYNDFWGRPGNGAPKETNRRMKLESTLYMPLPGEVEVN